MAQDTLIPTFMAGKLMVKTCESRDGMGAEAASDVATRLREILLKTRGSVNMIFAAAPSQIEFLFYLTQEPGINWGRVNGFHMDEYVGLDNNAVQSFSTFLRTHLFDKVPFNNVYFINGAAESIEAECARYTNLLNDNPVDIVCMGIGENTHIAFNDPHTADFNDAQMVKEVSLDEVSRLQQVHDGCFPQFDEVPKTAITLTVPALLRANSIYCIVPGNSKAWAVQQTMINEVNESFPSTSLKKHQHATLYLDSDSASKL